MTTLIKQKRGTRAQLDNAATAGSLNEGELYLVTDENVLAVGTGATTYEDVGPATKADIDALNVDADTLDTYHASAFGRLAATQTWTGVNTFPETAATDADDIVATKGYVDTAAGIQINGQPSLYMAEGIMDPRVARAWKRASSGTRRAQNGLIETVPADTPRLNFNADGTFDKYLIEPAATNLLEQSEALDQAPWVTANGASVSADQSTAPDGNQTADHIAFTGTINEQVRQPVSVSAADTPFTFTVWLKLISGTITDADVKVVIYGDVVSVPEADVGDEIKDGFVRVEVTATTNSLPSSITAQLRGDVAATIAAWGAQLEVGSAPTSYIPTTTTAATRAADDVVIDGADFDALGIKDGGTVVCEFITNSTDDNSTPWSVSDGTINNRIRVGDFIGRQIAFGTDGGTEQFTIQELSSPVVGLTVRQVLGFVENDVAFYIDGAQIGTDISAVLPTVDRLHLGFGQVAGQGDYGIRSLIIYPNRLTNAELEAASVVGQKLPGLAETTNRITQQFPYNAEPYTPYALTDVTTTGQTRTLDVTNGPVQTLLATENCTIDVIAPAGKVSTFYLYVYNNGSSISVTVNGDVYTLNNFPARTGIFHIVYTGVNPNVLGFIDDPSDARPT